MLLTFERVKNLTDCHSAGGAQYSAQRRSWGRIAVMRLNPTGKDKLLCYIP